MSEQSLKPPKPKKQPNNLFRVLGFYKELRLRLLLVVLVGSISIVMFAFMPSFLKNAFDVLKVWLASGDVSPPMSSVIENLIIFGVLMLFNALFDVFCIFTILKFEDKVLTGKILEVKRKLDVTPISFIEQFSVGDLTRRVASLTSAVVKSVITTIYTIARVAVFFTTTFIVMLTINWVLAFVVLASLPICVLTARFVSKRSQKFFNNYNKSSGEAYNYVDQKFTLQSFYNMHGIEDDGGKFKEIDKKQTHDMIGENTALAFNKIYITFIQNIMYLAVTLGFGLLYITQAIPTEFGALPAFLMYSNRFLDNAVVVTTATNLLQHIGAKSGRVFEILDCPDDVTEKEHVDIASIKQNIVFKNVSLDNGQEKLLDNISFAIPHGKSVAFVGPTGCGKSRIVELVAKLDIPTSGIIAVDGINLDEINSRSYYKCVGLALDKPFIFRGTIAENLLYGVRRALPENVMGITEQLGSHDFIDALDNGYETQLSENASILSTSQKQSINIARLVLQNPDLAIFNEAISGADTITEKTVYEKIMKLGKNQTQIFISHRLSSVEKCDTIYYMERGKILEKGTHAELMAKKKKYYKAYTGG